MSEITQSSSFNEANNSITLTDTPPAPAYTEEQQTMLDKQEGKKEEAKILGKFNSQEELEKSYLELEKKLSSPKQEEVNLPSEKNKEEATEEPVEEESSVFKRIEEMSAEDLNEDTIKEFSEQGVPKEFLEQFLAYKNKAAEATMNSMLGNTTREEIIDWVNENFNDSQKDAYNNTLKRGEESEIELMIKGIKSQMVDKSEPAPSTPNLLKADAVAKVSSGGYESQAQMLADMADPRYSKDPAYRTKVAQKVSKSNL
jgi:hypothetical protein